MARYFSAVQIALTGQAFAEAEQLAVRFFRLSQTEWKEHRYDFKTLAFLEHHEVREGAFAHLCKYQSRGGTDGQVEGVDFYRICLQDDRILDAVERASSFIRLGPLLLYIAAHELVHVVRFEQGEGHMNAPKAEQEGEEEKVHRITSDLLKPAADRDLNLVLDCFSNRYRIGDLT
ncbi:MAG: hypothetical protein FWE89_02605 [Syntrophaceae bacterium]|nr:hypothetical protein [Syntrophaceae bacterium]